MQLTDQQWAQLYESVDKGFCGEAYMLSAQDIQLLVQRGLDLAAANVVPEKKWRYAEL